MRPVSRPPTRNRCASPSGSRGFTLVELMVTLALATVLMMMAIPSYVSFNRNAKLSESVSSFIASFNLTRANAMKRGQNTLMIPRVSADGWSSGWIVFTDTNWDNAYTAGTDELVSEHDTLPTEITVTVISGEDEYLLFNGSGFPRLTNGSFSNGRFEFKTVERTTAVIYSQAGRVRSCKIESTDC